MFFAKVAKPEYTKEQMIDKAIIVIQKTGLYEPEVLKWNRFAEANQIEATIKKRMKFATYP
jgi:hypothetical protein